MRPVSDREYNDTIYEDDEAVQIRIYDLKNFFPEVPHQGFDRFLRFAIMLLLARNPAWRYF